MSRPTPDKSDLPARNHFIRYDEYWLKKARDSIDGTTQALTKRLESLNRFLNYLAAGTFLGVGGITYTTYLESPKWYIYLAFIIPLIFIGVAKYKVSVNGGELELRSTDMRSPTQINEAYFRIIAAQSARVKDAATYVGLATFFILICFPLAIFLQNLENTKEFPETYFSVTTDSKNLYLKGNLGSDEEVWAVLYGKDFKRKTKPPIYTDFLLQKKGQLNATIDLNKLGLKLDSVEFYYGKGKGKSSFKVTFPINKAKVQPNVNKQEEKDSTKLKGQ